MTYSSVQLFKAMIMIFSFIMGTFTSIDVILQSRPAAQDSFSGLDYFNRYYNYDLKLRTAIKAILKIYSCTQHKRDHHILQTQSMYLKDIFYSHF